MSLEQRWLPLFPLNAVLFPNALMPLQIFEERYKLMIEHCLGADSKFGVTLIKSGAEVGEPAIPYTMGTVAHIVQVNRVQGDRIFISVMGMQRFRIKKIEQYRPYLAAQVALLEEDHQSRIPPARIEAVRNTVTQHMQLVLGLKGGWVRTAKMPSDAVALSYLIAEVLQVELSERQALLEEASASNRLDLGLRLLQRQSEVLKRRVARELRRKYSRQ